MRNRFIIAIVMAASVLLPAALSGCAARPNFVPGLGRVTPIDGEINVATIPAFGWESEEGITDLYFQLYRADAFDYETKTPTGTMLLQLTGFSVGRNTVSLQNDAELQRRYAAVGPFVDKGLSTLAYNSDYVWLLIWKKGDKVFLKTFRFHTIAKTTR